MSGLVHTHTYSRYTISANASENGSCNERRQCLSLAEGKVAVRTEHSQTSATSAEICHFWWYVSVSYQERKCF